MSAKENKRLISHVLNELILKQNLDIVDEYCASDFVLHEPPPGISPDREGVKQFHRARDRAFSDSRFTINDQIAEGDKVVSRWTSHNKHTGEFMGIPPTGVQATVSGVSIHRLDEGKIKEEWTLADMLGLFRQLGALERSSADAG